MANPGESLAAHAAAHKLPPGQQLNLLICYLGMRKLFPEISLELFLERAPRLYGATKENAAFPKDALDKHCPTANSAWPPKERINLLLSYLQVCTILNAQNMGDPDLEGFLAEAAVPQAGATLPLTQPAGEVVATNPAAPPTPAQGTLSPNVAVAAQIEVPAPAVVAAPVAPVPVGTRSILRVEGREPLYGYMQQLPGYPAPVFLSDAGEIVPNAPTAAVTPTDTPAPMPVVATRQQTVVLTPAELATIQAYLASPPQANIPLGDDLWQKLVPFPDGTVQLAVCNAQPTPYLDCFFTQNSNVVHELPPRYHSVLGIYTIAHAGIEPTAVEVVCGG